MTTPTGDERDTAERELLAAIEAARPNQLTDDRAKTIRDAERRLHQIEQARELGTKTR